MPSKTAYRGKNEERPRAHGVHLVSESQNEGSIWACASSYPAHKREMPCIGSNTKRMMKTARKGSDSNTNCITPRHLRKYVHLRLELTYTERPIPSLQSLDTRNRVIYMGTFSKVLSPALRMSYLVLPPQLLDRWREKFARHYCPVPWLSQKVLYLFMSEG